MKFSQKIITTAFLLMATTCLQARMVKNNKHGRVTRRHTIKKPKIIAFSSTGGGGHKSTVKSIAQSLGEHYDLKVVNIFKEVLAPLDPIRMFTFNRHSGEDLYNHLLRTNSFRFANVLCCAYGRRRLLYYQRRIERLITAYFKQEKPDMIISTIPLVNFAVLNVAKKLQLPFLVVTCDLDTRHYVNGFKGVSYNKFAYTLAYDEDVMRSFIAKANIPSNQIKITGFPVRTSFHEMKNVAAIKKEFNLPSQKPVIMLLLGAVGSTNILLYAKRLARMKENFHLVVCIGRNKRLRKRLKTIRPNAAVSISVIGYTERIADLMQVSNLLITKPGPNTISEALHSNLPMLLDRTLSALQWERYNISFVKKYGFGSVIRHFYHVEPLVKKYLLDKKFYAQVKQNLRTFKKKNFSENIKKIVDDLLAIKHNELRKKTMVSSGQKDTPFKHTL